METLQRGKVSELPGTDVLYAYFPQHELLDTVAGLGQWRVQGLLELARKGTLNDQFPGLKPLTIREILDQCWKGK